MKKHPYLVAELDGEVAGYAYTHDFVGRTAYDHSAELTIYLKENVRKMGIGKNFTRLWKKSPRRRTSQTSTPVSAIRKRKTNI